MIKKQFITLVLVSTVWFGVHSSSFAASLANDAASNYTAWSNTGVTPANGGTGFGAWTFAQTGGGGQYLGITALSPSSSAFGVFGSGAGTSSANRAFTGALTDGQTFSLDIANTTNIANGGEIGINLLNGANVVFTIKFVGGASFWSANDGHAADFTTSQAYAANTPFHFTFTLNNGATDTYSYSFGSATGTTFVGSGAGYTNITGVRFYSNNQGGGDNIGVNNLAIVPEPSTVALLLGSSIVGGLFLIRRKRA